MGEAATAVEIPDGVHDVQFSAYDSPLFSYPLLRSRSRVKANLSVAADESPRTVISLADRSSESSDNPSSKLTIPNLRPLRDSVMLRQVGSAFDRRLCRFEVGGGKCRDKTCDDLHVGDLEPSDNEIALYLMESMGETLRHFSKVELADQLLQARKKTSHVSLEQRVAAALSSLVRVSSEDTLQ